MFSFRANANKMNVIISTILLLAQFANGAFQTSYESTRIAQNKHDGIIFQRMPISVSSFVQRRRNQQLYSFYNSDDDDDDTATSNEGVDWDSEWQKVVKNKDQPDKRPSGGKADVRVEGKSEVQISVEEALIEARSKIPKISIESLPTFRSLDGDFKFWIGVLIVVSIGLSLLQGAGVSSTYNNDSFLLE